MDNQQIILDSFFSTGLGRVNDPEIFKIVEPIIEKQKYKTDGISEYCLIAEENDELIDALEETADMLYEKYLSIIFKKNELIYTSLWKGVDKDAMVWHNDYCEGADLAFLCYFHTLNEHTGGSLQLHDLEKPDDIITVIPKKYDVVLFNQHLRWEHRVTPLIEIPTDRTVMNFGFQTENY